MKPTNEASMWGPSPSVDAVLARYDDVGRDVVPWLFLSEKIGDVCAVDLTVDGDRVLAWFDHDEGWQPIDHCAGLWAEIPIPPRFEDR